jgi:1-carboxybiuret hydrolase subunit AtzH-like protein
MEIDLPDVLADVSLAFERYEQALISNDVATLDALFHAEARTVRYGLAENLYGHAEVAAFRARRPAKDLARARARTVITTYGRDFAVASTLFYRDRFPPCRLARCRHGFGCRKVGTLWPPTSGLIDDPGKGSP